MSDLDNFYVLLSARRCPWRGR